MSAVMMVRVEGMNTLPVGTKVVIAGTGLVGFIHGGAECPTHRGERFRGFPPFVESRSRSFRRKSFRKLLTFW